MYARTVACSLLKFALKQASTTHQPLSHHLAVKAVSSHMNNNLFSTRFASTISQRQAMLDDINDLFVDARDEICDAIEDKDTTYFNDGVESAGKAVDAVMQKWELLLSELNEEEKARMQRSMGLKMAQLSAEYKQLQELHT